MEQVTQNEKDIFQSPSNENWFLKEKHHTTQKFIEATSRDNDLENSKQNILSQWNLTKEEREALNELKVRKNVIISNLDS